MIRHERKRASTLGNPKIKKALRRTRYLPRHPEHGALSTSQAKTHVCIIGRFGCNARPLGVVLKRGHDETQALKANPTPTSTTKSIQAVQEGGGGSLKLADPGSKAFQILAQLQESTLQELQLGCQDVTAFNQVLQALLAVHCVRHQTLVLHPPPRGRLAQGPSGRTC